LPEEFKGLLEKEKRVIDVPAPEVELVKRVIKEHVDAAGSV
jgi:threonine synthase